jgi:hypothetical protein
MKRLCCIVIGTVLLTACAASGPFYLPASEPDDRAALYVYRPHRGFQMAGFPNVYIDQKISHSLKNGSYGVTFLTFGRHEVKVSGSVLLNNWMLPDATIIVDAKAGETIFVRYTPEPTGAYVVGRAAGVTGSSTLLEVPEKDSRVEIRQTRRSD